MLVLNAICQKMDSIEPTYTRNIYKWLKMALFDAPYMFILDVQLEYMRLERDLSCTPYTEIHTHEE